MNSFPADRDWPVELSVAAALSRAEAASGCGNRRDSCRCDRDGHPLALLLPSLDTRAPEDVLPGRYRVFTEIETGVKGKFQRTGQETRRR